MLRNKLILSGLVIILLFVVSFATVLLINNKSTEIKTVEWTGLEEYSFSLGKLKLKSSTDMGRQGFSFVPKSENELSRAIDTNPYYVGKLSTIIEGANITDGSLFFKDNNYYLLFRNKSHYMLLNCFSYYSMGSMHISFPAMAKMSISSYDFELFGSKELLAPFFETFGFEQAKEFYSRLGEDIVTVNDESQQIYIKGYSLDDRKYIEDKCIVLNYQDKTIGYLDNETGIITIAA